jgi:hypothetical protein
MTKTDLGNSEHIQTQATIDANIGDENYDIGHNFNTFLVVVMQAVLVVFVLAEQRSGYTGGSNPTGDSLTLIM